MDKEIMEQKPDAKAAKNAKALVRVKRPKIRKTYVTIVLDRSGSMDAMRREAVDMFNDQVKVINENAGKIETRVSLVTFNDMVSKPEIWLAAPGELKPLTIAQYEPHSGTAMYDAVGMTIDKLLEVDDASDDSVAFLMIILSDGMENSSKKFTANDILEKVQKCEATGRWTFTYIGANQNLAELSKHIGIKESNMALFQATGDGLNYVSYVSMGATDNWLNKCAEGVLQQSDFFEEAPDKKKKQKK